MDILRKKRHHRINSRPQSGQILLIIVLATVIALTVGLSAISRTIINTRLSTEEASSQKALSAAEAGVEEIANNTSLLASGSHSKTLSDGTGFKALAAPIEGNTIILNDGATILQDDGADIWLSTHPDFSDPKWSGNLTVYWTNNAPNNAGECEKNAAIEIIILSGDKNNPTVTRRGYDSCNSRKNNNNFATPVGKNQTIEGINFVNSSGPILVTNGFIARIIPIYANTKIGAEGSVSLPIQGYIIDSTGTSGITSRRVRVYQGFPRLPIEFFPYNLFLPADN